jgi:hypothetical protein
MSAGTRKRWLAGLLSASLVSLTGCYGTYNELVDPCYPERWNCEARQAVQSRIAMQSKNGLDIEQTLFNYHFEANSDKISPNGQNLLTRLATRRPQPFREVFVQNSFDALANVKEFDPAQAAANAQAIRDLNERRRAAVLAFLNSRSPQAGEWQVAISFPSRVGMYSLEAFTAVDLMHGTPAGDFRPDGQGGATIVYAQTGGAGGGR